MFGVDRLTQLLKKNRHLDLDSIFNNLILSLKDYSQGCECNDDVTILGFQFQG